MVEPAAEFVPMAMLGHLVIIRAIAKLKLEEVAVVAITIAMADPKPIAILDSFTAA